MSAPVKLVWGAAMLSPHPETGEVTHIHETLDLIRSVGVEDLDTAQIYGDAEETLGKVNVAEKKFIISTKQGGGFKPGTGTKDGVLEHGAYASEKLGPIDIYYLHAPDASIPLEDTLEGIQKLYETGAFKRFGLSNYLPEDIQKVHDIASSKGWIKPTVFQGNYNPFARSPESTTFPLLRKLGISFYAYSPLAGGLLAKTKEQLATAAGRWTPGTPLGDIYRSLYDKEELRTALDDWEGIAKKEGISLAELGYRWVRYHSSLESQYGDAVIFGAYDEARIKQTVGWLNNGPLSEEAVKGIDAIWEKIKDVAPVDNYNSLPRKP
ncbi:hypothetical protein TWF481_011399 [Arthrobotrys musiformis]|uniref:NADP-dependent oxidoreductase domain-containing protein n=1 Tax=Arthrobotrys musiformis TaxID=47236 RepID=A0AAV9VZN0_9PEZI